MALKSIVPTISRPDNSKWRWNQSCPQFHDRITQNGLWNHCSYVTICLSDWRILWREMSGKWAGNRLREREPEALGIYLSEWLFFCLTFFHLRWKFKHFKDIRIYHAIPSSTLITILWRGQSGTCSWLIWREEPENTSTFPWRDYNTQADFNQ